MLPEHLQQADAAALDAERCEVKDRVEAQIAHLDHVDADPVEQPVAAVWALSWAPKD